MSDIPQEDVIRHIVERLEALEKKVFGKTHADAFQEGLQGK